MPVLLHLVVIVHRLFMLVLRFFADRTDELMRATTSSPAFIVIVFPGEHSLLCYLFYRFASLYYATLVLRCFSCLDPIIVYLAADILPTFHHLLPCFVCESCLSLASRSACLGLLFDDDGKLSSDTLFILLLSGNHLQSGIGGQ